jgi:hypothetical protein
MIWATISRVALAALVAVIAARLQEVNVVRWQQLGTNTL